MELDNLKDSWQSVKEEGPKTDISRMIQLESKGPIARLKRQFRKKMIILPIMAVWLYIALSPKHDISTDLLYWTYVCFCIVISYYSYQNYRQLSKMQKNDEPVLSFLQKEINYIKISLKRHSYITSFMFILFAVLIEITMYFNTEPSLHWWAAVSVPLRILAYAVCLVLKELLNRLIYYRRYKPHLDKLEGIINEMK